MGPYKTITCIDFNLDWIWIWSIENKRREGLHDAARKHTHPSYNVIRSLNAQTRCQSNFKQLVERRENEKWMKKLNEPQIHTQIQLVDSTPKFQLFTSISYRVWVLTTCALSVYSFIYLFFWLIFRDLCLHVKLLRIKNTNELDGHQTLNPNEDWCVWTRVIFFSFYFGLFVCLCGIEIERKATIGKLKTKKKIKLHIYWKREKSQTGFISNTCSIYTTVYQYSNKQTHIYT